MKHLSIKYSHLHQLIKHHSIKAGQVLDVVPLHDGAVLPDVGPELLHVEDQLCYVSAKNIARTNGHGGQ